MRILHTADWHLGKHLEGYSRMDEQEAFLNDFVEIVRENQIDIILIAGDVYDTSNPPARAERLFYDTLKNISANGERLILIIAGNHDNPERLVAAGPLARDHGIIMVGTPKTVVDTGNYGQHKVVNSSEGMVEVEINGENAVILTLAYPSEKRLNEVLYREATTEEDRLSSYTLRIQEFFRQLEHYYRDDTINLVVSHLFAMGSETVGSERNIQLGGSYIVDGSSFPQKAQYIALGHIHKPQIVPGTLKKARYSGSPIHYSKKEIHYPKMCNVIDLVPGGELNIEEIDFKVYKPIEVWKCTSIQHAIELCEKNKGRNCWTYLEIETDRYIKEDEIKIMKSYKDDIIEILPIINTVDDCFDTLENLTEKPFEEIFREFYFRERKVEPQEELVQLLMDVVKEEYIETAEAQA
ncbi:exonuclease subunit SbcD [Alkalibaculum sp. M08DMB]|uniref:Nuclease SbcCD subunit D n=1 Tax=Alkalibaculum sporogenes TaxID=2655001 RepID=A0A6A7K590_9FIRM|nr:exonuclease SbcCD subunit D [Alkalibaculum sporogenes]MPW24550.1 exonuclease subunit SbcD [Alkalibaculum sporogenes]